MLANALVNTVQNNTTLTAARRSCHLGTLAPSGIPRMAAIEIDKNSVHTVKVSDRLKLLTQPFSLLNSMLAWNLDTAYD